MTRYGSRRAVSLTLLVMLLSRASAQEGKDAPAKEKPPAEAPRTEALPPPPDNDYRQYFKKPQTPLEFWKALQFEQEVGRPDLSAALLHGLVASKPTDEALVELADREGMSAILRLRNLRPWVKAEMPDLKETKAEIEKLGKSRSDPEKYARLQAEVKHAEKEYNDAVKLNAQAQADSETLVSSVGEAVKRVRGDPKRIATLINLLSASPEENAYALRELYKSGALAVPQIIDGLRSPDAPDRAVLLDALRQLGSDVVPPIVAALDSDNAQLKFDLLDVLWRRAARQAVPSLWFLAASPTQQETVRRKATEVLSSFLDIERGRLPAAKAALTREAERYYRHQVRFADPAAVTVWRWENGHVTAGWPGVPSAPATVAEEYYGTRFANEALALDPTYRPAQIILLSLLLDKSAEKYGLEQPLSKSAPKVYELIASASPDLIDAVLERALDERRTAVALQAVRTLGAIADPRANRPTVRGESILVRALYYPDRRVEMAAAEAILRGPDPGASSASARVLDVLRRALASEPAKDNAQKVLIGFYNVAYAGRVAEAVRAAGFEPVPAHTGRDVLRRLGQAADIDLLLLDAALPDPGLASLMGQLNADTYAAHLPVILVAPPARAEALRRFYERDPRVEVAPEGIALAKEELKTLIKARIDAVPGAPPLSATETQDYAERSIRHLNGLAHGDPPGFDARPVAATVLDALRAGKLSPDGQLAAISTAGTFHGVRAQNELIGVVLDARRPVPVRVGATRELIHHIQINSPLLTQAQADALNTVLADPATDPALKAELAALRGSLRPDARLTGERLLHYAPPVPTATAPAAPAAPKEDKDKDKEKDKDNN